jgi:CysZ protein
MNGMDCFIKGLLLITKPGLRQYVVIPFLINFVVLSLLIAYGVTQYDQWMNMLTDSLPEWLGFLSWIIGVLAILMGIALLLYAFTIIGNIIAAPFNALLSVKVEEHLLGITLESDTPFHMVALRSVAREFSKLRYYLPRLLGLLVVTLIPGVNTLAPFLWLLFGAWMMAVQYTDVAADNNELAFAALRVRLGQHKLDALWFGLVVYILVAIPLLNLILIPAAVAGGTVFWVEQLRSSGPEKMPT